MGKRQGQQCLNVEKTLQVDVKLIGVVENNKNLANQQLVELGKFLRNIG